MKRWRVVVACVFMAVPLSAQVISRPPVVYSPPCCSTIEFDASPDHDGILPNGEPFVVGYSVTFIRVCSTPPCEPEPGVPVFFEDLGKPQPDALGHIGPLPSQSLAWLPSGVEFVAVVYTRTDADMVPSVPSAIFVKVP